MKNAEPQATADLYDRWEDKLQVLVPSLRSFGGRATFAGKVATVRAPEDNTLVRAALSEAGDGRVLVVDGAGSMQCALLGDQLAALALENEWSGVVVYGCSPDSEQTATMPLGVQALGTCPRKSVKRGRGERDVVLSFGGVDFRPGEPLFADGDGLVVGPLQ